MRLRPTGQNMILGRLKDDEMLCAHEPCLEKGLVISEVLGAFADPSRLALNSESLPSQLLVLPWNRLLPTGFALVTWTLPFPRAPAALAILPGIFELPLRNLRVPEASCNQRWLGLGSTWDHYPWLRTVPSYNIYCILK